MFPSLYDGDSLIVSKLSYGLGNPIRGDIIVFKAPPEPGEEFVKRVVGIPGDRILIANNKVYLNGEEDVENFLPADMVTRAGKFLPEDREITVPEGNYFVMGDNRPGSSDSRDWGYVPRANVVGKVVFRFWPLNDAGKPGWSNKDNDKGFVL